ncbi:MAG: cation:proton antiporter [Caldilineaceae bacterium]|nr:cation:proton antiporter [Caldilineaceae bacterium]
MSLTSWGPLIALFAASFVIVLAARQMGEIFARIKLPLISGFLFIGIIAGPFVLDFVHAENIPRFLLMDELALAFIAFAAGAELELKVIQGYFRSIVALIAGQVVGVLAVGITAFILIKEMVPFMSVLPLREVVAIALLGATIMIARSPSSALAVIKELRARGPFTHKVLGATILMDAVVIVFFAAGVSVAAALIEGTPFDVGLMLFVLFELLLDVGLGLLIGLTIHLMLKFPVKWIAKITILLIGLGVFVLATELHDVHLLGFPVGIASEPLLICMTAGFVVTNFSRFAVDFRHIIEELSPAVFLIFFTLVGIELELDVMGQIWLVVLILFVVRLVGIVVGTLAATTLTGDRSHNNNLLGLAFLTQAGVSIGLAKEIGVEFAAWGAELATLCIGVIVLNQIVGPPILKWAIAQTGEAHRRADTPAPDDRREAVIFGVEGQSLALARQLTSHGWTVQMVTCQPGIMESLTEDAPPIQLLPQLDLPALRTLDMSHADCAVLLLSDAENYTLCELIYEEFGIENVVVRLVERDNFDKFHALGARVVQPGTAMVSLLDQFVRSPLAASLLLGMEPDEVFMEFEMNNQNLHGVAIRDIHFPLDVLVLSISRRGHRLISHGYSRLEVGDHVTVVGSPDSLAEVEVRLRG